MEKMNIIAYRLAIALMTAIALFSAFLITYASRQLSQQSTQIKNTLLAWDEQAVTASSTVDLNAIVSDSDSESLSSLSEGKDIIGKLTIPSWNQSYAIVEGTDEAQLNKGVGHYEGSVLPGSVGNSVLAGHRDSVFRRLGDLKPGDELIVEIRGGTCTFRMSSSRIVDSDDRSLSLAADKPVLTLITCYPFRYIGNAPKRYLLTAELVSKRPLSKR